MSLDRAGTPESRRLRVSWFHAPCDAKETHFEGQDGGSDGYAPTDAGFIKLFGSFAVGGDA